MDLLDRARTLVRHGVRLTGQNDDHGHPLVTTPEHRDPLRLKDALELYEALDLAEVMEREQFAACVASARVPIPQPGRIPEELRTCRPGLVAVGR